MSNPDILVGIVLEEGLTLEQFAAACAVEPGWVVSRVSEGHFPPPPGSSGEWRFTTVSLRRARRMRAMERDFDAGPELAALIADMLEEVDELRTRLRLRELP